MKSKIYTLVLCQSAFRDFQESLRSFLGYPRSLQTLQDPGICDHLYHSAAFFFEKEIQEVLLKLDDPHLGIAAIDIPQLDAVSPTEDALLGAITAVGLNGNILLPVLDTINLTPFTVHNASYLNEKALANAGLAFNTPSEKLGFHSDGLFKEDGLSIPHTLMIYNLWISYKEPGNFYWVPTSSWRERKKYEEIFGINQNYTIEMTPIAYGDGDGKMLISSSPVVEAPVFWSENSSNSIFLNGRVIGREECVLEMKESISKQATPFAIPQRSRRILFARNSSGFHARDIFEKPIPGFKYTRCMIRSVDQSGHSIAKAPQIFNKNAAA